MGAANHWSLRGVRSYLRSRDVEWPAFYSRFVESNLSPKRYYEEGRAYKASKVSSRATLSMQRPRRSLAPVLRHLTSHTVRIKPGSSLPRRPRLKVAVRALRGGAADPVARLVVRKKSGKVSRLNVKLNRSGRGSRTLRIDRRKVRKIDLVLSNASLRYRSCGGRSAWACGGKPRDDGQRFDVTLRAVR